MTEYKSTPLVFFLEFLEVARGRKTISEKKKTLLNSSNNTYQQKLYFSEEEPILV